MVAVAVLAILTLINCMGVRSGSNVQSGLMLLKIGAIAALVLPGLWFALRPPQPPRRRRFDVTSRSVGAAMTPVMFSYGGWQTSSFVAGEMRNPQRDLARGLLLGVAGVILLYCAVGFRLRACARARGTGSIQNSGDGRHAAGTRRQRRELHRYRDRDLGAWVSSARAC